MASLAQMLMEGDPHDPKLKELEAILGKLSALHQKCHQIPDAARLLKETAERTSVLDRNFTKRAPPKVTKRELEKLANLAMRLCQHIRSMHDDALTIVDMDLEDGWREPFDVALDLARLAVIAESASKETICVEGLRPPDRRRKQQAFEVAIAAVQVYEDLTGNPATIRVNPSKSSRAYGPALDFLTAVFKKLEIDAKAEAQLRSVLKLRHQCKSKARRHPK